MISPEQKAAVAELVGLLGNVAPLIAAFSTVIFCIWAALRARSAHFLLDKVWRVVGSGKIHDAELERDWHRVRDLEGFRFRTGINFNTKAVWVKTIKWLEFNGRSISELSFARAWIADSPWHFKQPWLKTINAFAFIVFLLTAPVIMLMVFMFSENSVVLTVKGSDVAFWTDGSVATNFWLAWDTPAFSISLASCVGNGIVGLSDADFRVICSSLDPEVMPILKGLLLQQRLLSGYIGFMCFVFLLLSIRYVARARMATIFYGLQNRGIT